jgi:hypothetical protein
MEHRNESYSYNQSNMYPETPKLTQFEIERNVINDIRTRKSNRAKVNDENKRSSYDQRNVPISNQVSTIEDETEILKKMHRQA